MLNGKSLNYLLVFPFSFTPSFYAMMKLHIVAVSFTHDSYFPHASYSTRVFFICISVCISFGAFYFPFCFIVVEIIINEKERKVKDTI